MELRVIGAGLPRTGTTSLKAALEVLLGAPCYHMDELNRNEGEHMPLWSQALQGDYNALDQVLYGYSAAVDWPAALVWPTLLELNPDVLVVLSHRGDAATWWKSVNETVWAAMRNPDISPRWSAFSQVMREAMDLGEDWDTAAVAQKRYDDLYAEVVALVPPQQLVIWEARQGWQPLCEALNLPIPDADFFHRNTTAEFRDGNELGDL